MPAKKKVKTKQGKKAKPTMAKPKAQVNVKMPQKPKYNVLGTAVGAVAKALDSKLTGGLGHKIYAALTGSGDYVEETKKMPFEVSANTVVHSSLIPSVPNIANDGGMVRVRHREYITDIAINESGEAFTVFNLQPGDAKAFPWLSNLANRFQQYKLLGGVFEYVTLCGNAVSAAVPALGAINVVVQYDVTRQYMTDPREILNTYYSNSGVISADLMLSLECETTEQPCQVYMIRDPDPNLPQPADSRWYDFGRIELSIRGAPRAPPGTSNYVAGQLWFTYDILLIKPVIHEKQEFPFQEHKRNVPIAVVVPTPQPVLQPVTQQQPIQTQLPLPTPEATGGWLRR